MTRSVVVLTTDHHAGHRLGLCCPDAVLPADIEVGRDKKERPKLGEFQKMLWSLFDDYTSRAADFANGAPTTLLNLGDPTQGDKYKDMLMSTRMGDQILIARENELHAARKFNLQRFIFGAGTSAHTFGEGSAEMLLAQYIADNTDAKTGVVYHGVVNIDGVGIDFKHHGPGIGKRIHLEGDQVRRHLRDVVNKQRAHSSQRPARLYCSGHRHIFAWETWRERFQGELYRYDYLSVPSFCGMGDYGHQATLSEAFQSIGLVAIEIEDGEVGEILPLHKTIDIRSVL